MKTNELMIGDWVCYDGDDNCDAPAKYSGIPYQTKWVDGFKTGYRKAKEE